MLESHEDTRDRLLHAAGEEFAAKGYESATIRSISRRAGANIAAVNYYFASKEVLYTAAVLEAHKCASHGEPPPELGEGDPAELLREHVRYFLRSILAVGRKDAWHQALILREMLSPTHATQPVVEQVIRPRYQNLCVIVSRLRPDLQGRDLQAAVFSLVGQCLFYKMACPVAEELVGEKSFRSLDLDYLTDHITSFTLNALIARSRAPEDDDSVISDPSQGRK